MTRTAVVVFCIRCNNGFKCTPSRMSNGGKYCSRLCHVQDRKDKGIHQTQETKDKIRHALLGRPFSEERRLKIKMARAKQVMPPRTLEQRLKVSGSKAWNWKGGISSGSERIRHTFEYSRWRKAVLIRDGYACRLCCSEDNLNAHHLFSFAGYPHLRTVVRNGVTLCESCHRYAHRVCDNSGEAEL